MNHCSLSLPQLKTQLHLFIKTAKLIFTNPATKETVRQDVVMFLPVGDSQLSTLPLCCSSDPT